MLISVSIFSEETWTLDRFDEYKTILWPQRGGDTRLSIHEIAVPRSRRNAVRWSEASVPWDRRRIYTRSSARNDRRPLHTRLQPHGISNRVLPGWAYGLWAGSSAIGICKCTRARHLQSRLHRRIVQTVWTWRKTDARSGNAILVFWLVAIEMVSFSCS